MSGRYHLNSAVLHVLVMEGVSLAEAESDLREGMVCCAIANSQNLTQAAKRLHIHRNTLHAILRRARSKEACACQLPR